MAARKDSLLGQFSLHQSSVESVTVSPSEDIVITIFFSFC